MRCTKTNTNECHYPSSGRTLSSLHSQEVNGLGASPSLIDPSQSPEPVQVQSIRTEKASLEPTANLLLFSGSTEHLPSCSLSDLFLLFGPAAHALDLGPGSSIISLTIPIAAQSPAVFHAMISCSSILLSWKEPSWGNIAIRHYCKTLRSLALEMTETNLRDSTVTASTMAVVIMLHFFEVCRV